MDSYQSVDIYTTNFFENSPRTHRERCCSGSLYFASLRRRIIFVSCSDSYTAAAMTYFTAPATVAVPSNYCAIVRQRVHNGLVEQEGEEGARVEFPTRGKAEEGEGGNGTFAQSQKASRNTSSSALDKWRDGHNLVLWSSLLLRDDNFHR